MQPQITELDALVDRFEVSTHKPRVMAHIFDPRTPRAKAGLLQA